MRFNLIGPFEIVCDDGEVRLPTTPKVCQTLALLLTRPNEVVPAELLIQELWGDRPPRSAHATVQTYIHQARRVLEPCWTGEDQLLVTRPLGYLIQVPRDDVDITLFERLVDRAGAELERRMPDAAARSLRSALALWRGPVLSSVPTGQILGGRVAHLAELRIRALELRIEADNQLGRHRENIPELRSLVHDYPLNEWFHGQLIHALHRAGRRAEALQAYQSLYRILSTELGLEPSTELQHLQLAVLDPSGAHRPATLGA
ncbi:BTAD domain-containing putative transcriptional regulator [Streptomyces sp. NPDC057638]|uniref:AfsR/SARP family transcriptional regulator n=1 Tax=Streptomyces sp. NPDC057638 TaxID=3346190 RepID=UPI0036A77388